MRKIYTLALALFVAATVSAQVTVTFKVDVTNYLAQDGVELNENGMRVGGDFTDQGASVANWSPSGIL